MKDIFTRRFAIAAALVVALSALATAIAHWRPRAGSRRVAVGAGVEGPLVAFAPGSGIDASVADAFSTLRSLEEARTMDHTAVILQGDEGGQIYLTAPVKHVRCDEAALHALLAAIDAIEWRDPSRASLTFDLAPIGSGIFGGMGGGFIVDGVWVHPRLDAAGILPVATSVIFGRQTIDEALHAFPRALP